MIKNNSLFKNNANTTIYALIYDEKSRISKVKPEYKLFIGANARKAKYNNDGIFAIKPVNYTKSKLLIDDQQDNICCNQYLLDDLQYIQDYDNENIQNKILISKELYYKVKCVIKINNNIDIRHFNEILTGAITFTTDLKIPNLYDMLLDAIDMNRQK